MLLKATLLALMAFVAAVALLKVSVAYENYVLLGAGMGLALAGVVLGMHQPKGTAAA